MEVYSTGGAMICKITDINSDSDTYDCPYTLTTSDADLNTKLKDGLSLFVSAIKYPNQNPIALERKDVTGFYAGPPPLDAGICCTKYVLTYFFYFDKTHDVLYD